MSESILDIGSYHVGSGHPCFIIAEIGINHNGDIDIAKKLIDSAIHAGCQAVKFQKRTVDIVFSEKELAKFRESPFGDTNGELKRGLEFGQEEYEIIDGYCRKKEIIWFASCWDEDSLEFIEQFSPPCYKVASASLTDDNLLNHHKKYSEPKILSTGMSSLAQIDHAVQIFGEKDLALLHCHSTYPANNEELNLNCIQTLRNRYQLPIGYSGHEVGLVTSVAAACLGACIIERHITLDRSMWGSDQAASVEPHGMKRMVSYVRAVEAAMGDGEKRVWESEVPVRQKLRRIG
ncbi:NeuB: N-acetylneuraminate synthase [Desulfosarcina variabilis str. Montpellier]|uniref:N-acetylneuraminate synthase family protein n=1 Tax=Desulfosarcina variabilis TaxID=2300 RepID=UPI003AFB4538